MRGNGLEHLRGGHIGREAGTGGQLPPTFDDRIQREPGRPFRRARALVEQGEGSIRPDQGIDIGAVRQARTGEWHSAPRNPRGQRDHLRAAQFRAPTRPAAISSSQ